MKKFELICLYTMLLLNGLIVGLVVMGALMGLPDVPVAGGINSAAFALLCYELIGYKERELEQAKASKEES